MKQLIASIVFAALVIMLSISSNTEAFAMSTTGSTITHDTTILSDVLQSYFQMKDAGVRGKAALMQKSAGDLVTALKNVNQSTLTAAERKEFVSLQMSLTASATKIENTDDIEQIRTEFATLSESMHSLVDALKSHITETIYVDYCPMKKATWLSSERVIANPYFGQSMRTCGSVKEMIH